MLIAAIALAGALGAVARLGLDTVIGRRRRSTFPAGTVAVNISGSLLLGILTGLGLYHGLSFASRAVLGTGFCGAYTTFSTFTFETVRLAEDGRWGEAVANLGVSVIGATAAAGLGLALASL